jgi:hypothetical protein
LGVPGRFETFHPSRSRLVAAGGKATEGGSEVTERLSVEVPNADSAISLIDELKDLHAEIVPSEGGHCVVQVELEDDRERQLLAVLDAVERWLASSGIEATRARLGERSYALERRAGSRVPLVASSEQRVAKNEVLFREVNERIGQAAERAGFAGPMVFVCECGDADCAETIEVTLDEYEAARSQPTLFLIALDHELQSERLLERNERYAIAEKVGEAAAIAQRHDPRA